MWGMGPSFEGYGGGEEEWGEECYGDLNAEYNGPMMNMYDNSGVFMGHDGNSMDYGGDEMMGEIGMGDMGPMGSMMGPMGGMMMGGTEVKQRGSTRGQRGANHRGGEYFPPRRGVLSQRFPWSQGAPGGPRGKGGRGRGRARGQSGQGPSLGNANLTPLGGSSMGGMRGMGATRFGFGSMGMMFGRGGSRGGRGNSGGFHEESFESFQARCNPQAAFTIGAEANEAFKSQFQGMGARNSVSIRGWGAQPPLKKTKVPPVRESL